LALRSTSKRKPPVEKEIIDNAQAKAVSTPQRSDKALKPEGTSPMKIAALAHDNSNLGRQTTDADSSTKSDPKDLDSWSKPDSLADAIASARKELFKASSPAEDEDDAITVATSKSKKWKPIKRIKKVAASTLDSSNPVVDLTGPGSNRRGTTFATNTNFKEREKAAAATTPGPGKATEADEFKEVVAQVRIKILPGAEDI
jgi:hypothetical protein